MELKGMPPIPVENVPDGNVLFQIAFRHDGRTHVINMMGDAASLIASKKVRDAVIRKGFLNVAMLNMSSVFGVKLDAGIEDVEISEAGDVEAAGASESPRATNLVKLH
jgi:hypothetical protein